MGVVLVNADFEAWAMRGLVVFLGGNLLKTWASKSKQQDDSASKMSTAIDSLNKAIADVALAVERMNASIAKEYATKPELTASESRLQALFAMCRENCPERLK